MVLIYKVSTLFYAYFWKFFGREDRIDTMLRHLYTFVKPRYNFETVRW